MKPHSRAIEPSQLALGKKMATLTKSVSRATGCTVESDREVGCCFLRFYTDNALVTIGVSFADTQSNADLLIKTTTTLPDTEWRKGHARRAVKKLIAWALSEGLENIQATQAPEHVNGFWVKCDFVPLNNATSDYKYKPV